MADDLAVRAPAAPFCPLEPRHVRQLLYPELSMRGLAPSVVDPESAAARDIARIAMEIVNREGETHGKIIAA
jgi:chromosome partitioning protein